MRVAMSVLVFYTAVVATAALVLRLAVRGWRSPIGRHLTATSAALATAFVLWAVSIAWGPLPRLLWILVLAHIAAVLTWRLVLQVRALRR